jgi:hypothetical protein
VAHERIEETRHNYRRAKQQMTVQSMGVSALQPALITSLSSMLDIGIFAPAGVVASLAAAAAAQLMWRSKRPAARRLNPAGHTSSISRRG